MTPREREALADGIRRFEGWREEETTVVSPARQAAPAGEAPDDSIPAPREPAPRQDANGSGGLSKADEALMEQLRGQVRGLDQKAGKNWDDNSERIAASALVMARQMGANAGDDLRLGFNRATGQHAEGAMLHLVRGGPSASVDPAANRAMLPTQEALSQSPQERFQQAEAIGQAQAEQQRLAQQQAMTRGPDDLTKGGPVRS